MKTQNEYTSMEEIREVIMWAADQVGYPAWLARTIGVSYNGRFTRRIGDANFIKHRIRFSTQLWPFATPEDRRETIVHEFLHIADRYFGNKKRGSHHGVTWKLLMLKCGYAGDRCHNIDPPGLRRRNKGTLNYTCKCPGKVIPLGKKRGARHAKCLSLGRRGFSCKICRAELTLKK